MVRYWKLATSKIVGDGVLQRGVYKTRLVDDFEIGLFGKVKPCKKKEGYWEYNLPRFIVVEEKYAPKFGRYYIDILTNVKIDILKNSLNYKDITKLPGYYEGEGIYFDEYNDYEDYNLDIGEINEIKAKEILLEWSGENFEKFMAEYNNFINNSKKAFEIKKKEHDNELSNSVDLISEIKQKAKTFNLK